MNLKNSLRFSVPLAAFALLTACSHAPGRQAPAPGWSNNEIRQTSHADNDDLLTAGLGAAGLMSPVPPAFADAGNPTPAELRRRAIWANWRGIADLAPGGGFGQLYGSLAPVPGREFQAFATLDGARQPHRVMLQLPDDFDAAKRCLVVASSSGSRGVYGAIALAGSWGLSHGCAVAYTDKGAGTGLVDTADGGGARLDGTRGNAGAALEFSAPLHAGEGLAPVAVKHAHSQDNPEADWGRHVEQAARFALQVLGDARPGDAPFTPANTRVIAVGVSNGGGAVLRAAESTGDWFDGVVAISPNVLPSEGGRALYDYSTEAALLMPCALNAAAFDGVALARPGGKPSPAGVARCASLQQAGLPGEAVENLPERAHMKLQQAGWSDGAIGAGAISSGFDLWRAVAITYASAYARTDAGHMPCGYSFHALDAAGLARAPTAAERAAWWSDSAGIPPGAGVGISDSTIVAGPDPMLPGLQCLRALWSGDDALAARARQGIEATRAALPRRGLPVLVMHGADDGLVPAAFSGFAYADWAKRSGRDVRLWRVRNAQHFDAFLGLPVLGSRYLPMLPYAFHGLDAMWSHVAEGKPLPGDADISTKPRSWNGAALAPLAAENLGAMP